MDQNHCNSSSTTAIGFCLLPSELIHNILLYLALPEIIGLKSLNKSILNIISDQDFVREFNLQSRSSTWLFVYKKRWHRDAVLHGFTDRSDRWFKIQIANLLKSLISPGESIYLLKASGNFLLFASNARREIVAVNFVTKTVTRIPPSPLGPRGTSAWRRSGMKLVSNSDHFQFLFAEMVENRPLLFVYDSTTDTWRSMEAGENLNGLLRLTTARGGDCIFLNLINEPNQSVVMAVGLECDQRVIVRPRLDWGRYDGQRIGFSWGNLIDRLHVYGDGHMLVVKTNGADEVGTGVRLLSGIELWGIGLNGADWECVSRVPCRIMEQIRKPYLAIMGCLEGRDGIIRAVLLSNFDGLWDIIWLSYDIRSRHWIWVPLPDCKMKGLNMAGIAFSSGLTLS